jgi:hypothetical protein
MGNEEVRTLVAGLNVDSENKAKYSSSLKHSGHVSFSNTQLNETNLFGPSQIER